MKFYRLNEIPIQRGDHVFKVSPLSKSMAVLVFFGIALASLLLGMYGGFHPGKHGIDLPAGLFYYISGVCAVMGLIFLGPLRASLRPTNWLLRCHQTGVLIHYRSYLNWHLPVEDLQAVGFDYSEIAWVRAVKERRASPYIDAGNQVTSLIHLDFCLANADTSILAAHLEAERNRWPASRRMMSRALDYPVEVLPGGILRLRWKDAIHCIVPDVRQAIQTLSRSVRIAPEDSVKTDLTRDRNLDPSEEDAKILKLLKSGDKIGALKLTRETYGCSLAEAMEFVEKIERTVAHAPK